MQTVQKHHLILDTNVYRSDRSRKGLAFVALSRLCRAEVVQLHIPYIVKREFQTQQSRLCRDGFDVTKKSLKEMLKIGLPRGQSDSVTELLGQVKAISTGVSEATEVEFVEWADGLHAAWPNLLEEETSAALEAYFNGTTPLTLPKTRDDIPDSFLYQQIKTIHEEQGSMTVICKDKKLSKAVRGIEGVTVHGYLGAFIESDDIQLELLKLAAVDDVREVGDQLQKFEEENGVFEEYVGAFAGTAIEGKSIHSVSIPDDNNEAVILGYGEVESLDFNFAKVQYFGGTDFGIPFEFDMEVLAFYYLFKWDLHELDQDKLSCLTDHNDHYYEVEDDFSIRVAGVLKVTVLPSAVLGKGDLTIGDADPDGFDSFGRIHLSGDEVFED